MSSEVKRVICRRCGQPRDDNHVRAPYLCEWNGDREAVGAAIRRAEFRVVDAKKTS